MVPSWGTSSEGAQMATDLYLYLSDFLSSWAGLLWSALLVVDVLGLILSKDQSKTLNDSLNRFVSEGWRLRISRALLVVLLFWAGFSVWREQHHLLMTNAQRQIVTNMLSEFLRESADMQRACQDNNAPIPNVGLWKGRVVAYLNTLDPSYSARFEGGLTDMLLPGPDGPHEACWTDLHTRERNLKDFFADFRPITVTE
jgi:hypothetical protein